MNNITNFHDLKEQCHAHMANNGLSITEDILNDGKIHRYSTDNNKHKRDEWYIAFDGVSPQGMPYLNVVYGSWSKGITCVYNSYAITEISFTQRQELQKLWQKQKEEANRQVQELFNYTAIEVSKEWETFYSMPPDNSFSRYLKLKGIRSINDVRYGLNPNGYPATIIPIRNIIGNIRSLQYISVADDDVVYKTFRREAEKKGNFYTIGNESLDSGPIYVVEGYATGASVYEAVNKPVVVAFDAGNIDPVIGSIRKHHPSTSIIIAADNDEVGKKKAHDAAKRYNCTVIIPVFQQPHNNLTDFNDLHMSNGIDTVKAQLVPTQKNLREDNLSLTKPVKEPCDLFHLTKLPQPLAQYISVLSTTTNAHPIMITASVLTMVSSFLGKRVYIPEGDDGYFQKLYTNLWILCIAKSGQFKTTAINKGAKLAYKKQNLVTRDMKILQMNLDTCSPEEKNSLIDAINQKSLESVVLPTKITAEAFVEHLSKGHSGAVYVSEFGGWLQNLDKTHNNDFKATLTEFYDVPQHYRYKTKTQGDFIIEEPYMSICGVSTLPWIQSNIKPSDVPSGFFARFMIFTPPYEASIPPALPIRNSTLAEDAEKDFELVMQNILQEVGDSKIFKLSRRAKDHFERSHRIIYSMLAEYTEHARDVLEPYLKRWSPSLLKLAMIMQLFIDPMQTEICAEALDCAWAILVTAIKSTSMLFEGELGESDHQRKCRIMYEWIAKKMHETGAPVKRQAIMASKKLTGGSKEYDSILQTLIDQGRIECKENQKKNDSEYWIVEKVE